MSNRQATPRHTDIFADLRAENETRWLADLYIRPQQISSMLGMRSCLFLGESGSGKTSLRYALARENLDQDGRPRSLVADWRFAPPPLGLQGSDLASECADRIFQVCARALLAQIGMQPQRAAAAPKWVLNVLRRLLHTYLHSAWEDEIERLSPQIEPEGANFLAALGEAAPAAASRLPLRAPEVIAQFADVATQLGYEGIWVMVDDLEPWFEIDQEHTAHCAKALLGTLALFEVPAFSIKIFAPAALQPLLGAGGGVGRRRLDAYTLRWSEQELQAVLERRLSLLHDRRPFALCDLCAGDTLLARLRRYGGGNPRGWLRLARPFVEAYDRQESSGPLPPAASAAIAEADPPLLQIDALTNQVYLGFTQVSGLSQSSLRLLLYLYRQQTTICPRSELYYCGHLNLDHEPHSAHDEHWESPAAWSHVLDSALSRLREQIEPNPKQPRYIITVRNAGIRLQYVQ